MPRYEVIETGFYGNVMYKPGHHRHGILRTDEPLKPVPTWLKPIKEETAAERKKRVAKESKQSKADAEKQKQDEADIASVTFTDEPKQSGVETL